MDPITLLVISSPHYPFLRFLDRLPQPVTVFTGNDLDFLKAARSGSRRDSQRLSRRLGAAGDPAAGRSASSGSMPCPPASRKFYRPN